jgi:hypothetical protein
VVAGRHQVVEDDARVVVELDEHDRAVDPVVERSSASVVPIQAKSVSSRWESSSRIFTSACPSLVQPT